MGGRKDGILVQANRYAQVCLVEIKVRLSKCIRYGVLLL